MKQALLLIITSLSLFACKNESRNLAEELCDCLKDAGFNSELNTNNMLTGLKNDLPCFKEFQEHFYNELKPLDNKERAKFMKDFSKALLNTYCGEIAFDMIPYDGFLERLEELKNYPVDGSKNGIFHNPVSICECINLDEDTADEEAIRNCEKLEEEIETEYMNASQEEREELERIIEECENR